MVAPWKQKATAGGGDHEIPPAGSHPAILVGLLDLGTHTETFKDKTKGTEKQSNVRKLLLVWELTAEKMSGMKEANHVIGKDYNLYPGGMGPKSAIRKLIEGWRGKKLADNEEFDFQKLLGQKCMLTVTHGTSQTTGKDYAKIESVSPVPKGMNVPAQKREKVLYSVDDDCPIPDWVPYIYGEKAEDVAMRSHEAKGIAKQYEVEPAGASANGNDDPPF